MAQIKAQITQELVDYLARHARQDEVLARVERETAEMPDRDDGDHARRGGAADDAGAPGRGASGAGDRDVHGLRGDLDRARACRRRVADLPRGLGGVRRDRAPEHREAGLSDRVEIVVGPADEALRAMPDEPTFDYVFIDADKSGYPTYYDLVVPRLVSGGLLLLDNVLLRGGVVEPQDERTRIMDALERPGDGRRARRQRDGVRGRRAHAGAQALNELLGDGEPEPLDRHPRRGLSAPSV